MRCFNLSMRSLYALSFLCMFVTCVPLQSRDGDALPSLNIDMQSITVSGISSGAYFAVQFHVTFSKSIHGAGVFAGGPFWCAHDDVVTALGACMKHPSLISVTALEAAADAALATFTIDPLTNLKDDKVWFFTGTKDSVVASGVVDKAHDFYDHYVTSEHSHMEASFPSEHAWVTDRFGNDCDYLGHPYINNCGFDAAGSLMKFLVGDLKDRVANASTSNLIKFSQKLYTPLHVSPTDMSLGPTGYAFIPPACYDTKATQCKLHIVFHGCEQSVEAIGEDLVVHSGINEWAEANNIVVLYPQTSHSDVLPYNPKGCWDWWGYTGTAYATRLGPQMDTVKNMVGNLTGSFKSHWEQ